MKRIDLTGRKFGRLSVIEQAGRNPNGISMWKCICDCGNERVVQYGNLTLNNTVSCGCWRRENGGGKLQHGDSKRGRQSVEFRCWQSIKQRCYNPNASRYERYGGRGIKVCERWLNSFENFLADMGRKPSASHSIDRYPNPDGDYEPGNCRWATPAQQHENQQTHSDRAPNGKFARKLELA